MTKSKQTDELDDSIRVLVSGTCDTLTGSSRLTYNVGSLPDGEIYLRVHGNTGGGFFSREWISLQDILRALEKRPSGKAITSILLHPLFRGKSANLSADAFGITLCLYAYSHLSFAGPDAFADICSDHYYRLREFMMEHPEAGAILKATD